MPWDVVAVPVRWSRQRLFPKVCLAVGLLLAAMLVNWEVPARALDIDGAGPACIYPDRPAGTPTAWLEVELLGCPEPGGVAPVGLRVHTERDVREVHATLHGTGLGDGATVETASVDGDGRRLLLAQASFAGRSRHQLSGVATVEVDAPGDGWRETTLFDSVVVEVSPSCTMGYRGARPTGPAVCPR